MLNHSFIEVNIMGSIIFFLLIINNNVQNNRKSVSILNKVLFFIMFSSLSDMFYYINAERIYTGSIFISTFLMIIYFVSLVLSSYYWLMYTYEELSISNRKTFFEKMLLFTPTIIVIVMTLLSPLTHWIFYINSANAYVRGTLYFVQPILTYGYIIYSSIISFRQYSKEILKDRKRSCYILSFYTLLPIIGGIMQIFNFGLNTAIPTVVIAIVILYLDNIKREISLDNLTRLNNRGQFDRYINLKINSPIKNELYLIILDIDNFKFINDTFGHIEGDNAIVMVANILKTIFTTNTAFLSRYGGDEFTIVIDTSEELVLSYLNDINNALLNHSSTLPYKVSVSAGYEKYDSASTIEQLIRSADEKMYNNKQNNREKIPAKSISSEL